MAERAQVDGWVNDRGRSPGRESDVVQAKLQIVAGDETPQQFVLQLPAIIGRSRSTDVRLGHPLVSRHHCELFERAGHLMVRDLGSLNGTFVGDTRLSDEPMPLASGERFTIGTVTLEASYASSADGALAKEQRGTQTILAPIEGCLPEAERHDDFEADSKE